MGLFGNEVRREFIARPDAAKGQITADIAQDTAFAEPFNYRAVDGFRFRPAIQILIEAVDRLGDDSCLLFRRQLAFEVHDRLSRNLFGALQQR